MPDYFSDVRSVLLFAFSIIATLAVALRFRSRRIQKMRFERDDYFIVPGLVGALPLLALFALIRPLR